MQGKTPQEKLFVHWSKGRETLFLVILNKHFNFNHHSDLRRGRPFRVPGVQNGKGGSKSGSWTFHCLPKQLLSKSSRTCPEMASNPSTFFVHSSTIEIKLHVDVDPRGRSL